MPNGNVLEVLEVLKETPFLPLLTLALLACGDEAVLANGLA